MIQEAQRKLEKARQEKIDLAKNLQTTNRKLQALKNLNDGKSQQIIAYEQRIQELEHSISNEQATNPNESDIALLTSVMADDESKMEAMNNDAEVIDCYLKTHIDAIE